MKKQKGNAGIFYLAFVTFVFLCWVGNVMKLTDCDFKGGEGTDVRCEVIHGIGVLGPISMVTVWFDDDNDNK